jgi:hypothetical protein
MFTPRHADRIDLRPLGIAAAAATVVLSSTIALAALNPFGFGGPATRDEVTFSASVIASARQWEVQRLQQSPYYIDWPMRSASQWEVQRLQQSPYAS